MMSRRNAILAIPAYARRGHSRGVTGRAARHRGGRVAPECHPGWPCLPSGSPKRKRGVMRVATSTGHRDAVRHSARIPVARAPGFLADRPEAVTALTSIFLAEIERLLGTAAAASSDSNAPASAQPRLGAVSFLHRFGSALNRHVHLHACITDGVFASEVIRTRRSGLHPPLPPRTARPPRRPGPAATQAPAPLPRGLRPESPAPLRRHRDCDRQRLRSPSPSGRGPG